MLRVRVDAFSLLMLHQRMGAIHRFNAPDIGARRWLVIECPVVDQMQALPFQDGSEGEIEAWIAFRCVATK